MFEKTLLSQKVIVVTGGGTGLGKSMATRFGELGAKLVLTSRKEENLRTAAREIEAKTGAQVLVVPCDVRNYDDVEKMIQGTVERFGSVDCLVNNAAGNFLAATEDLSPRGFDAVVKIVLNGTFHATVAAGKQMIAQKTGGNILSIVTTYAWTGSAFVIPSAVAKAGVLALMRSLAVEWAEYKIRCNAIAPGPFPTEGAWAALMPGTGAEEQARARIPARRFGEHHELANLASYLLADGSAYVTGACYTIDGGEWLANGGSFNQLAVHDRTAVKQLLAAMKPKRS
ncbi:MAG: SDR family oxidoreductase [Deltaproteobacteria bacterium]|nr:SDR family oxidoreductase [Deltaproteobacteria bacterium]